MTLVGDEVVYALEAQECSVTQHTYTKWLSINDLFEGDLISNASLAFAAFVAMRQISEFKTKDKENIANMLNLRREEKGVPLMWDVLIVKPK